MCLGFLALGPAPFLLGLPWTRALAWVDQVLGFVLFGVGFAFVVVRFFGGMVWHCWGLWGRQIAHGGGERRAHRPFFIIRNHDNHQCSVVPLMHNYLLKLEGAGKEKDDFISAVNSAASSLGEFAGAYVR